MNFDITLKCNQKRGQQLLGLLVHSLTMQYRKCKGLYIVQKVVFVPGLKRH